MSDWDIDPPAKDDPSRASPPAPDPAPKASASDSERSATPSGAAVADAPPAGKSTVAAAGQGGGAASGRGRRRIPYRWVSVAAVALLIGLIGGYFISHAQTSGDEAILAEKDARLGELQAALAQSQDRNWTYYRANQTLKTQLDQATSNASTTTNPLGQQGVFSDGVYVVGEDIPSGTYDGVVRGSFGYWARLKGSDGSIAQIIENGLPRGPFVLTIEPGDHAVELRGVTLSQR
jgi:hypothetical protein